MGHGLVSVIRHGKLDDEAVDAIINPADARLTHTSGIAAAIAHRGGDRLVKESESWIRHHQSLAVCDVAVTTGGACTLCCRFLWSYSPPLPPAPLPAGVLK